MGRFLIYFSYFGTRYSGLQRQTRLVKGEPVRTVQSALDDALKRLRPANDFKTILSSRTDKGVHSLKNSCHVDLEYPEEGKEYDPDVITNVLNYGLEKGLHDVRVLETRRVNSRFHARLSARERKYVYRLAHHVGPLQTEEEREERLKEVKKYFMPRHKYPRMPERHPLPLTDVYRVRSFRETLDIPKLIAAAEICSGIHDYASFTTPPKTRGNDYFPHPVKLLNIGVKRGHPFTHSLNVIGHDTARNMEFWDIHVRARSFLFRQIRRLVGGMVLVAKNKINLADLQDILDQPQVNFPFAGHMNLQETGLFLLDVEYDPEDLIFDESKEEVPARDALPTSNTSLPEDNKACRTFDEENRNTVLEESGNKSMDDLESSDGNTSSDKHFDAEDRVVQRER